MLLDKSNNGFLFLPVTSLDDMLTSRTIQRVVLLCHVELSHLIYGLLSKLSENAAGSIMSVVEPCFLDFCTIPTVEGLN